MNLAGPGAAGAGFRLAALDYGLSSSRLFYF